jgi:hypothetical protein
MTILQTPAGGIPARSGIRCGSANCKPFYIDENDNLIEITDDDDNSIDVPVKNIFGGEVSGDSYITAKENHGKLAADAEDCG